MAACRNRQSHRARSRTLRCSCETLGRCRHPCQCLGRTLAAAPAVAISSTSAILPVPCALPTAPVAWPASRSAATMAPLPYFLASRRTAPCLKQNLRRWNSGGRSAVVRANIKGVFSTYKALKDGTRRVYWYHRETGERLRGEPGSPEFIADLAAAEKLIRDRLAGTFNNLVRLFTLSTEFDTTLAASTKAEYGACSRRPRPSSATCRLRRSMTRACAGISWTGARRSRALPVSAKRTTGSPPSRQC